MVFCVSGGLLGEDQEKTLRLFSKFVSDTTQPRHDRDRLNEVIQEGDEVLALIARDWPVWLLVST